MYTGRSDRLIRKLSASEAADILARVLQPDWEEAIQGSIRTVLEQLIERNDESVRVDLERQETRARIEDLLRIYLWESQSAQDD